MKSEYSRPATIDDLKFLIRALNKHKVGYLLIGGYALYAHGYNRATVDIDLLVSSNPETGRQLKTALMALPDHAAKDISPAWFQKRETIRVADEFVVDIMFNAAGKTYQDLEKYAETIDLDGIPVRTVNLAGLLLTKHTVRDKDKADRCVLERALRDIAEAKKNKKKDRI